LLESVLSLREEEIISLHKLQSKSNVGGTGGQLLITQVAAQSGPAWAAKPIQNADCLSSSHKEGLSFLIIANRTSCFARTVDDTEVAELTANDTEI
jgi:hypothetical protein